jgi:hypothetical protein
MKKISKSEILELDETLETDSSSKLFCDKPYRIERLEKNGEIAWYGYNTNWMYENNQWYVLESSKWKECDIPEYEKMYMSMDIKKIRRLKLNNIENEK